MHLSQSQVWRVLYGEAKRDNVSREFLEGLRRLGNLPGLSELEEQLHRFEPYPRDVYLRYKRSKVAASKKKTRRK
jgi:hypothetical protein